MYILRAFAFFSCLAQVVLGEQPTPILPDPKLTPGDTFDVGVRLSFKTRLIADIPRQMEGANKFATKPDADASYRRPNNQGCGDQNRKCFVLFDDRLSMKIKTAGAGAVSPGSKIKSVHEAKAEFRIEFEDGSSATFCPGRSRPSVAVRDKNKCGRISGVNLPEGPKKPVNGV
jgi:hypothetical protein